MAGLSLRLHYGAPALVPENESNTPPHLHAPAGVLNSSASMERGLVPRLVRPESSTNADSSAGSVCGWARPPLDRAAAGTTIKEVS